jgi:hypothetical protein
MLTGHAPIRRLELATHLIVGSSIAVFLVAVGQPIITDDLWWHLALGDAYAQQGLWLAHDPLLFTSPGPPVPASWLADLGLAAIAKLGGLNALRVVHRSLTGATAASLSRPNIESDRFVGHFSDATRDTIVVVRSSSNVQRCRPPNPSLTECRIVRKEHREHRVVVVCFLCELRASVFPVRMS